MCNNPQLCAHLSELFAKRRNYRQEIKDLVDQYQYVVFYGCGIILNRIIDTWNMYIDREIDYCCDRNSEKWGKFFRGIKCISPQELLKIKDKCALFVTVGDFEPVFMSLKKSGFPSVNQIYKYDLAASAFLSQCDNSQIQAKLCQLYEILADEQSKKVYNSVINRVLDTGDNFDIMAKVCEKNQYFPMDIFTLSKHECFVDGGAFDGDTITVFIETTNAKFDAIYSFELDEINFRSLKENVKSMPHNDKIILFNKGIWDSECEIAYSVGNSDSCIGEGAGRGCVVSLDRILLNERITYIKMDIEGAEPRALRGAQGIITAQKPKLAICIYHDFRHLWKIPLYLKELVPEYKIYLRHHTNLEYETVCYAVV